MAERDEGFDLLPPESDPLGAEEELALEDELEESPFAGVAIEQPPPPPLGRTPAYDFVARAFTPAVSGGALVLYGEATLAQWVEKALRTRLGENPGVDPTFGVNVLPTDLLEGGQIDETELAEALDDWERALKVHPRVSGVEDWDVAYDDANDAVFVDVHVTAAGAGEPVPVSFTIGA